jgi:hypothetical protein
MISTEPQRCWDYIYVDISLDHPSRELRIDS